VRNGGFEELRRARIECVVLTAVPVWHPIAEPRTVPHASRPWSLYGLQLGAHPLGIGQPTGYTLRGVSTMFPRPGYVLANSTCHDG
jgi:hypothetical protein